MPDLDLYTEHPVPSTTHIRQRLSSSGRELLYLGQNSASLKIIRLQDGTTEALNLHDLFPPNVILMSVETALWCPYSDDRILLLCVTRTDPGVGTFGTRGLNLYVFDRTRNELERITPPQFGPAGSESGFYVRSWLTGSSADADSIYMGPARGVYVPQISRFITGDKRNLIAQSRDGLHHVGVDYQAIVLDAQLDGRSLPTPFELQELHKATWSGNGRYLALWVQPEDGYPKILVYDLQSYLATGTSPGMPTEIDLAVQHCAFSSLGSYPEFVSDTTLAVSMHRYGGNTSELWEIGLNGRKVRQLSFGSN